MNKSLKYDIESNNQVRAIHFHVIDLSIRNPTENNTWWF